MSAFGANLRCASRCAATSAYQVRLNDPVKAASVQGFLDDSEKAASKDRSIDSTASLRTREDKDNVMIEARDEKSKTVVHRSYVRKN